MAAARERFGAIPQRDCEVRRPTVAQYWVAQSHRNKPLQIRP
ncbi:hypothetical protein CBM2637_A170243 [Cupriavidus taiwanensis]|nr:hypothetical protein CBM2637_A170243 [Cupriavidus taiwanensis]